MNSAQKQIEDLYFLLEIHDHDREKNAIQLA